MRIVALLVGLMLVAGAQALERKAMEQVSLGALSEDTQVQFESGSNQHFAMAWWVPYEYWATVFSQDPNIPAQAKAHMQDMLKNYVVIAIVQSDMSPMGAFNFYSKKEVMENLTVRYQRGDNKPIVLEQAETVSNDMSLLMSQMTPVLQAAMGNMGSNFHFYIYEDKDAKGRRLLDPYREGAVTVGLKRRDGQPIHSKIEAPLNALFVPRTCPNGKPAHVSWQYCPWSGEAL